MTPPVEEWVIVADVDSGASIVRSGFLTLGEAGAARREMEARMADTDTTNLLILVRQDAAIYLTNTKAK